MIRAVVVALAAVSLVAIGARDAAASTGTVKVLGHAGTYASIQSAIDAARPGETIEVDGGIYRERLRVVAPVSLVGKNLPVIDGGGEGTIVAIDSPGVLVSGFELRNSGDSLNREDSAISVDAPGARIENNRISDALFGIYLRRADGSRVLDNHIEGMDLGLARRGDGIRVWSSKNVTVGRNVVEGGRDVVLWYSNGIQVHANSVTNGRYGLHFMYCDDAAVTDNRLIDNSVGAFLMYSRRIQLRNNLITGNRGPSGYGIGLKDIDDAVLSGNVIVNNRIGINVDNTPRELNSSLAVLSNVLAVNDAGARLMPSVKRNRYEGNSFLDNLEQVQVAGGGSIADNYWGGAERGNFWSDYVGYDADGDGIGDLEYRAEALSEKLMDTRPETRILRHGPAIAAVDVAARAFPFLRPEPKLVDPAPLMRPVTPPMSASGGPGPIPLAGAASAVAILGLSLAFVPGFRRRPGTAARAAAPKGAAPAVSVSGVTKRYGDLTALDDVSFEIHSGQSVAIWGENGAGKTTLLRCVVGLVPCGGEVRILGVDRADRPRAALSLMAMLHQEPGFHEDLTVSQTIDFYSSLRAAGPLQVGLGDLGLAPHAHKRVRELSGGLKQRLKLAVALIGSPPVLLMDEPTSNLDRAGRLELIRILNEVRRTGRTLLFTSHRVEEVVLLADRVLEFRDGRLVSDETAAEFGARMDGRSLDREVAAPGEFDDRSNGHHAGQGARGGTIHG